MVEKLIENEREYALNTYGSFASTHEAYAVIREECEEAYEAIGHLGFWLENFWTQIKSKDATDKVKVESVTAMRRYCKDAITEFAQVAACCDKALELFPVAPTEVE